ncbi:MAG: radical SAM protein, partial [Firmicutes bacterium]|nr:radical SAM protein [Bacillota bacterium]
EETEALCDLIRRTGLQKVQIRNLNIDCDWFYDQCGLEREKSLGMDSLIQAFHQCGVAVGNYSRHKEK